MSEHLVVLDVDWTPDAGAPEPVLIQDEGHAVLVFDRAGGQGVVVVEFDGCLAAQFGYPNDEALRGHRLYSVGLRPYGVYEVVDSEWIAHIRAANRLSFPSSELPKVRHFVITFHDSTFECLAAAFQAKATSSDVARVGTVRVATVDTRRR